MKLEVHPKEGRKEIFILSVDEEPWKEIHRSIFGKKPTIKFTISTLEDLQQRFQEYEYTRTKNYVYWRLSQKSYSSFELKILLSERLVSDDTAEQVISEIQQSGYINDNDWLSGFVRRQTASKHGPKAIEMKLKAKGVPEHLIAEFLGAAEDSDQQKEGIRRLLSTRYKSRDLTDYKERQKVIAALLRKGYHFEEVLSSINDQDNA